VYGEETFEKIGKVKRGPKRRREKDECIFKRRPRSSLKKKRLVRSVRRDWEPGGKRTSATNRIRRLRSGTVRAHLVRYPGNTRRQLPASGNAAMVIPPRTMWRRRDPPVRRWGYRWVLRYTETNGGVEWRRGESVPSLFLRTYPIVLLHRRSNTAVFAFGKFVFTANDLEIAICDK